MAVEPETVEVEEERPAPVVVSTETTWSDGIDPLTGEPVQLAHIEHVLNTDPPPAVDPEDEPAPIAKPKAYVLQKLTNAELLAAPVGEFRAYPEPEPENVQEAKPAPQDQLQGQPPAWNEPSAAESAVAPVDGIKKVRVPKSDQPAPVAGA